jgi:hypothetical protein
MVLIKGYVRKHPTFGSPSIHILDILSLLLNCIVSLSLMVSAKIHIRYLSKAYKSFIKTWFRHKKSSSLSSIDVDNLRRRNQTQQVRFIYIQTHSCVCIVLWFHFTFDFMNDFFMHRNSPNLIKVLTINDLYLFIRNLL